MISHGLRLAAMSTLESPEVVEAFGRVVECAVARGKAQAVEELAESQLLTVPLAEVPGYKEDAFDKLVEAMEKMKVFEFPHISLLERDQDYPISLIMQGLTLARHVAEDTEGHPNFFLKPDESQLMVLVFARPRDILNPFALEKEISLERCLELHATRAAHKKGIKGKVVLCGVGAAHLPRSDGIPVSIPPVSLEDVSLLKRLDEAGEMASSASSSCHRRARSI